MVVVAKLKAKEGSEKKMKVLLTGMVEQVKKEADTLVYSLHQDLSHPGVFLFYEKYKDADALTFHSETSYFKDLFTVLKPLLEEAPKIEMYEEIASIS